MKKSCIPDRRFTGMMGESPSFGCSGLRSASDGRYSVKNFLEKSIKLPQV